MPSAGLEPATLTIEASCSIQLSYEGKENQPFSGSVFFALSSYVSLADYFASTGLLFGIRELMITDSLAKTL